MRRLVGQIHHVAGGASGQRRSSSNKTQTNCRALVQVQLSDVCVRVLASFFGETTMFNLDISTFEVGVKPGCVFLVVVSQPEKIC